MIIAKIASISTPPAACTHLPTCRPAIVIPTSAAMTIAIVSAITQFWAITCRDARARRCSRGTA